MVISSLVFTSCRKDSFVKGDSQNTNTSGNTYIKILDGPQKSLFLDAKTGTASVDVFNVRKDAANSSTLNLATAVTLTAAPDLITKYNTDNPQADGSPNTYEVLPESIFTPGAGLTKTATGYVMNLNPGDFAKDFKINLNYDQFNFSKKYALAFKITNSDNATTTSTSQNQVIVLISIKNAYDGVYSCVAGTVQRYSAPNVPTVGDALNGSMAGNPDVRISTVNANTVQIDGLAWFGGTSGIAGIANLQATIDPATNLVTMKSLGNATLANIAGAVNKYDPSTKTFTLNFIWNPTANVREVKGLTLTYKGSR